MNPSPVEAVKPVLTRRKRRRRRRRAILVAILLLPIVFIAWNAATTSRPVPNPNGYPETLEELNAYYKEVPPEENAALVYEKVFALQKYPAAHQAVCEEREKNDLPPIAPTDPLPEDLKAAMAHDLEANREAIELLYQAAAMEKCRFALDFGQGFALELKHHSSIEQSVQLLSMQAELAVENGDCETALKAFLARLAVSQCLLNEPVLRSQICRSTYLAGACISLKRILNRITLSDAALEQIEEALLNIEQPEAFTRALIGERCMGLASFDNPDVTGGEFVVGSVVNEVVRDLSPIDSGKVISKAYRWSGFRNVDRDTYLEAMDYLIDLSRRPLTERADPDWGEKFLSWRTPLSRSLVPSLSWYRNTQRNNAVKARLAQAAIAIERYRLANGSLPAALSDLVPGFLPEILVDPFDGEPLRYKVEPDGYTIYSVGRNGKDDEGLESQRNPWNEGDIAFAVVH